LTEEIISTWIVETIASYLDIPISEIDALQPLANYGIDSVHALSLCGDIEDKFGFYVDPTLAWDYPTPNAIASFIASRLSSR
jgi:acyl carrier protein